MRRASRAAVLIAYGALLAGCGGRAYVYEDPGTPDFRDRAETQVDGPVRVSAFVPGRDETRAVFGVDLYDQGIQPLWLEVHNSGPVQLRYAPTGTDRFYFSPMEVAWKNRGGYSDEARADMQRRFDRLAMPRYIDPGEARSGFLFTHADTGAKGFNVEVFSHSEAYLFTFLLRVPGFVPDYANVDFDSIYAADELTVVHGDELHGAIRELPCCSTEDEAGNYAGAVNVVFVGAGRDILPALLRSRWIETSASESVDNQPNFLFGRKQDAIFRYESFADNSVYELRIWLAPILHGEDRVWVGQARHFFSQRGLIRHPDPDVDYARNFTLQNLMYGAALEKLAWVSGDQVFPVDDFWKNLLRDTFFSDGDRAVLWLSPEPFSPLDVRALDWDKPTEWNR